MFGFPWVFSIDNYFQDSYARVFSGQQNWRNVVLNRVSGKDKIICINVYIQAESEHMASKFPSWPRIVYALNSWPLRSAQLYSTCNLCCWNVQVSGILTVFEIFTKFWSTLFTHEKKGSVTTVTIWHCRNLAGSSRIQIHAWEKCCPCILDV
jgi:hypothetical protein